MSILITCYHLPQSGGETPVLTFEAADVADLQTRVEQFYADLKGGYAFALISVDGTQYMMYQPQDLEAAWVVNVDSHFTQDWGTWSAAMEAGRV